MLMSTTCFDDVVFQAYEVKIGLSEIEDAVEGLDFEVSPLYPCGPSIPATVADYAGSIPARGSTTPKASATTTGTHTRRALARCNGTCTTALRYMRTRNAEDQKWTIVDQLSSTRAEAATRAGPWP
jgi:hypothetical protein